MTVFHHLNHMVTSMLKSIAFVKNINNRNNNLLFQYMISLQGFKIVLNYTLNIGIT